MTPLYVDAAGAVTSIGLDVRRTVASLRGGLDGFREIPFWGASGNDLQAAPIRGFAEGVQGLDRYEALAIKAILPCFANSADGDRERTGVIIGLPRPERPGVPQGLRDALRSRVADRLKLPLGSIHVVERGRVSVFWAMAQARRGIEAGHISACVVGGVDSLVGGNSLRALAAAHQLKEEWDGFIPGEAAAFIRVSNRMTTGGWGRAASAVAGIGFASEPADGSADHPLVGVGVNSAFQQAIREAGARDADVQLYLNDVNGSRVSFEDAAMGQVRFFRTPREQHLETWHVASHVGETGAATGALEVIWACAALELGFAPDGGLMLSTSDGDTRGALFMRGGDRDADRRQAYVQIGLGEPAAHNDPSEDSTSTEFDPGLRIPEIDRLHPELAWQDLQESSWLWSIREEHHRGLDPWTDIEGFERRLIAHLDALAWSGQIGRALAATGLESEDLNEAAASAMALFSFVPRPDTEGLIRSAMRESEDRGKAILAVVPHLPQACTDPVMRRALEVDSPALIVAALRALTICGRMTNELLQDVVQRADPSILTEAVHAAGSGGLFQSYGWLAETLRAYPSLHIGGLSRVAWLNLALGARAHVDVDALVRESPIAAALLCLRYDREFLSMVSIDESASPSLLEAVGWGGEQQARPMLLDCLEYGGAAQKRAAANALFRIYGVACYEEADGANADRSGPSKVQSHRGFAEDRESWEAALQGQPQGGIRLRHGVPWSRRSAIEHLRRPDQNFPERLIASWEYAIVNETSVPLHPSLFVQRQRDLLSRQS